MDMVNFYYNFCFDIVKIFLANRMVYLFFMYAKKYNQNTISGTSTITRYKIHRKLQREM